MEQYYVLMRILLEIRDLKCIEQEIYEVTWEPLFRFVIPG